MSHHEFQRILSSVKGLTRDQARQLSRELESRMAAAVDPPASPESQGEAREETAFDVASRAGLIGCLEGAPRSPADLSTNPKHMGGFGRG